MLLFVVFVVVFTVLWGALIQRRLRRRARSELRFIAEPLPEKKHPNDGDLVVMRGRLVGIRQDKPLPSGTALLDANGARPVHLDVGLSLERGKEHVALVGPYQVLLGAREGLPSGEGRRLLRVGDDVLVSGRWSVQKIETATYRDVVVKGAIVPSVDDLEIAFVGTPIAIGLPEASIVKGLAWGAFFWAVSITAGAYTALEFAYKMDSEFQVLPVASFVYVSPLLRSNAETFVRDHAGLLHVRDFDSALRWAAIESFLDPDHECLKTLENLRQTGRIEIEAQLGQRCEGQLSKRRAAEALVYLGEFGKAAEILQKNPPTVKSIRSNPDTALDVLVAVVTKDWSQAAKLIRIHRHPGMAPPEEECLALGLEARGGSFLSRDKLKSKAKTHLTCAVLEADLLEKNERLAFIKQIPEEMLDDGSKYLREKPILRRLQAESDPRRHSFAYIEPSPRRMFALLFNPRAFDATPAIGLRAVENFEAMDPSLPESAGEQAKLEVSLAQFFAMTGDDSEAIRLFDRGLRRFLPNDSSYMDAAVSRAAIAVRSDDPKASEYIAETEAIEKLRYQDSSAYLRWAHEMRKGAWPENSQTFNQELASRESFEALLKGSGKDLLAHCPPGELVDRVLLAGRRIKTDRELLFDKIQYYDLQCSVLLCPLEYLAHHAAMRALALRQLRPEEIGKDADVRALEERARKLRAPLLQRELAVILYLIEKG